MTDPLGGNDLIGLGAIWNAIMSSDEWWIDRAGHKTRIVNLDPSHRENIRRYLRRHCARLELVTSLYLLSRLPEDAGPLADELATQTPLEWLYSTPLFHALVAADTPPSVNE